MKIRAVQAASDQEIQLIAKRMRMTLMEVLGAEEGAQLYTLDWLRERVRFHLDPDQCVAQVLLAESEEEDDAASTSAASSLESKILGHAIVRVEPARGKAVPSSPDEYGLMSTIYVPPDHRRQGIAEALLDAVETWVSARGLARCATNTGKHNLKLIQLMEKRGYEIRLRTEDMVQLVREP